MFDFDDEKAKKGFKVHFSFSTFALASIPLFKATKIKVILSVIILLDFAILTTSWATCYTHYSIRSIFRNFCVITLQHSFDENLSNKPSDASKKKSSVAGFMSITLISGSLNMKFLISLGELGSPSISFISIFLQSKSPKALEIANLPRTRPYTIYPP